MPLLWVGFLNDDSVISLLRHAYQWAHCQSIDDGFVYVGCNAAAESRPGGMREARSGKCAAPRLLISDYGVPLSTACPVSSTRPSPGRPAAPLTDPDDVGPMQKSDASVGFD